MDAPREPGRQGASELRFRAALNTCWTPCAALATSPRKALFCAFRLHLCEGDRPLGARPGFSW
eukprot:6581537-Alexandrium_andersonii.AAC.1